MWRLQWIQGFHLCVHYKCALLTESIISPISRDDWTLFSCPQTVPGAVLSERSLSSGLGASSVPCFHCHPHRMAARRWVAPPPRLPWLSVFHHCRTSPHQRADGQFKEHWLVLTRSLQREQLQGLEVTAVIWAKRLWNCWPMRKWL